MFILKKEGNPNLANNIFLTDTVLMPDRKTTQLISPEAFSASAGGVDVELDLWSRNFVFDHSYWSCDKDMPNYAGLER